MPVLPTKRRMEAVLFREGRVVLNDEQTHVILFLSTGKTEHRFALDLASARTLTDGIERALAEAG